MCFVPILCAKNYVEQYYKIKLLLKFNVPEIFHVYRCIVSTWEWVHHKPEAIHYILTLLDDSKEGIWKLININSQAYINVKLSADNYLYILVKSMICFKEYKS